VTAGAVQENVTPMFCVFSATGGSPDLTSGLFLIV
jgi:hypothetical protein